MTDFTPRIIHGDTIEVLRGLESVSVNCAVTSPPYWGLRRYDVCSCSVSYKRPKAPAQKVNTAPRPPPQTGPPTPDTKTPPG